MRQGALATCARSAPSLLLSVAPGGRYLQGSDGRPFPLRGDTPWSLPVQMLRSDVDQYLDNRKAKKFNAILVETINVADGYADNAPANAYGAQPFVGGDFTVRNEPYWQHIDYIVNAAAARGIVVLMCALYLGFNGGSEGWYSAAVSAGTTAIQNYGAFLGARYAGASNIIWVNGGDYTPPDLTIPNALATGILSADTRHLFSTHWGRGAAGSDLVGGASASWLTLNSAYSDQGDVSSEVLTAYQASPTRPAMLIEARYEGTFSGQPTLTAANLRQEAWHAYLSGACGYMYGHHTIWPVDSGWQSAMDATGAQQLVHLHTFLESKPWHLLVPDSGNALVTAGRGTSGTATYVTAALSSDAALGVAYVPGGGSITVDLSQMAGSGAVTARWLDPTTGLYTPATGSPLAQSSHAFVASSEVGNNAAGATDWVLVLEA